MDAASADDEDDVQIIKIVKKPVTWVSSSFGDFEFEQVPKKKSAAAPKTSIKTFQQERREISEIKLLKRPREHINHPIKPVSLQKDQPIKAALNNDLWLEKHKPLSKSELAVHKKKVEAIEDWLNHSSHFITKHKAPILLLTGPPGAGKTACIDVLCAELGLNMQEWTSTSEQAVDQWSESDFISGEKSRVDVYMSQSQSSNFHNFLLRANKYHALDLIEPKASSIKQTKTIANSHNKRQRSVIIVEDIPNIFFRDVLKFHDILRNYYYSGHCPLVFILSDSNNNSCSNLKLFPKDLQFQLKITNIRYSYSPVKAVSMHYSLNPVASTVLIKLLTAVVGKEARLGSAGDFCGTLRIKLRVPIYLPYGEQGKFRVPSTSVMEAIVMSSSGDIRLAINTLQFACRSETTDLRALFPSLSENKKKKSSMSRPKSKTSSREDHSQSDNPQLLLGVKDTSVFLFHAVGKILYFKRGNPKDYPNYQSLPSHLKEYDRDPLLCDPEDVVHKSHLSGNYFNSFLHENYVDFISSVEDLERATNYFSDADFLSSQWAAREELENYAISVATRGYIHSNSEVCKHDSSRKTGWKPLHRSQWFNVNKQALENITTALQLFQGYHWEPEVLCTEIMPYISLTNPTLHDAGQISFVQEMTQYSKSKTVLRPQQERLDERDIIADDEDDESIKTNTESHSRQSNVSKTVNSSVHADCSDDGWMESDGPNSQTKVQDLNYIDEVVIEDFDDEF